MKVFLLWVLATLIVTGFLLFGVFLLVRAPVIADRWNQVGEKLFAPPGLPPRPKWQRAFNVWLLRLAGVICIVFSLPGYYVLAINLYYMLFRR
jgi:hypothetical protein